MKTIYCNVYSANTGQQIEPETLQLEIPISDKPLWQVESELAEELGPEYGQRVRVKIKNGPVDRY